MDNKILNIVMVVLLVATLAVGIVTCAGVFTRTEVVPEPTPTVEPTPTPTIEPTPTPTIEPTPTPTIEPTPTPTPSDIWIDPEDLTHVISECGGGYDLDIEFDVTEWLPVNNQDVFVLKISELAPQYTWKVVQGSNNVMNLATIKRNGYDYILVKFLMPNTETLVKILPVDVNNNAGGWYTPAPDGLYFAVADVSEFAWYFPAE